MRIGAGVKDNDNGYKQLKDHPFFSNIDFEKVKLLQIPINIKSPHSDEGPLESISWVDLGGAENAATIVY